MSGSGSVEIHEVAPRDGLQNESGWIDIDDKVRLVDSISDCGFGKIEVGSFVNPRLVPQMAGTGEVLARIRRRPGTVYSALVANNRGLDAAIAAGVGGVAVFASATEGFSMANVGATVADSLGRIRSLAGQAAGRRLPVRGYVSCVVECPSYDQKQRVEKKRRLYIVPRAFLWKTPRLPCRFHVSILHTGSPLPAVMA